MLTLNYFCPKTWLRLMMTWYHKHINNVESTLELSNFIYYDYLMILHTASISYLKRRLNKKNASYYRLGQAFILCMWPILWIITLSILSYWYISNQKSNRGFSRFRWILTKYYFIEIYPKYKNHTPIKQNKSSCKKNRKSGQERTRKTP